MMKRMGRLLPWLCAFALLGTAGCAAETTDEDGAVEGEVATAKEALSGWGSWHGLNGTYLEGPTRGNYRGMYLRTGGIVDAAAFCLDHYHNSNDGWGWHWGPQWVGPYGNTGGGTLMPTTLCPTGYPHIVGIYGQAGDNVGRLGIICGNTASSAKVTLPAHGDTSWGPYTSFTDTCDYGLIVTDIDLRVGPYVNGIRIQCTALIPPRE